MLHSPAASAVLVSTESAITDVMAEAHVSVTSSHSHAMSVPTTRALKLVSDGSDKTTVQAAIDLVRARPGKLAMDIVQFMSSAWLLRPHLHAEWLESMAFHSLDPTACLPLFVEVCCMLRTAYDTPLCALVVVYLCMELLLCTNAFVGGSTKSWCCLEAGVPFSC